MSMDGRKSKGIAQIISARKIKQAEEDRKAREKKKEITEEEHNTRLRILKEAGILK